METHSFPIPVANGVGGPAAASSTDNAIARWDGTSGRVLQNSVVLIDDVGQVLVNDTTNSLMTIGLTLNQGSNDDYIIDLKSSSVAHGITDIAETDSYLVGSKISGTAGGFVMRGFSETTTGLRLQGIHTADNTTKSASGTAALSLVGSLKNGTTVAALGSAANIVSIGDGAGSVWLMDHDGAAWQLGKTIGYNAITTAGWGNPAIYGAGRVAGTIDSRAAAAATYTVGAADGTFEVSGNVLVTASATHSFSLDVAYTDESSVARTLILPMFQLAGAAITGGLITNVTGVGPYESPVLHIRCKTATSITIRVSNGTFTSVTYNSEGSIKQVA